MRDAFLSASPFPPDVAKAMADRADEYKVAMMIEDNAKKALAVGDLFAKHLGREGDISITSDVWETYCSVLMYAVQQVNENIKGLK